MRITDLLMHTLPVYSAYVKSTDFCTIGTMMVSEVVVLDTGLNSAAYHHTLQISPSYS